MNNCLTYEEQEIVRIIHTPRINFKNKYPISEECLMCYCTDIDSYVDYLAIFNIFKTAICDPSESLISINPCRLLYNIANNWFFYSYGTKLDYEIVYNRSSPSFCQEMIVTIQIRLSDDNNNGKVLFHYTFDLDDIDKCIKVLKELIENKQVQINNIMK